jgi:hypothetical protein
MRLDMETTSAADDEVGFRGHEILRAGIHAAETF